MTPAPAQTWPRECDPLERDAHGNQHPKVTEIWRRIFDLRNRIRKLEMRYAGQILRNTKLGDWEAINGKRERPNCRKYRKRRS